jgi:hypothetical protein
MLHPYYQQTDVRAQLALQWQTQPAMRIENLFTEDAITAMYEALATCPFTFSHLQTETLSFQYWKHLLRPDDLESPLRPLQQWLATPGRQWVQDITGEPLENANEPSTAACLYTKGCFLDPHNDTGHGRAVAFVLGLTPGEWSRERGGWLHFLDGEGQTISARPPGFNTLDLFDVSAPHTLHEVPLLQAHLRRYTIAGWYYQPT